MMSAPETDQLRPGWVAVIDDQPAMRAMMTAALHGQGITVQSFPSAEDYLRLGHRGKPQCLVLDMKLPGMSGLQLYEKLLTMGPYPPAVVFISGVEDEVFSQLVSRGAVSFLQKPFPIDDLTRLVRLYLARDIEENRASPQ
jgi:two-component system response regulator TtrR